MKIHSIIFCCLAVTAFACANEPAVSIQPVSFTVKYQETNWKKPGIVINFLCEIKGDAKFSEKTENSIKDDGCHLTVTDSTGAKLGIIESKSIEIKDKENDHFVLSAKIEKLPTKGTEWIKIEGTISPTIMSQPTTSEIQNIDVEPDQSGKITVDNVTYEIERTEKDNISVAATVKTNLPPFKLDFFDADGNKLKSQNLLSSSYEDLLTKRVHYDYKIPGITKTIRFSVSSWLKQEKKEIPINSTISLGL